MEEKQKIEQPVFSKYRMLATCCFVGVYTTAFVLGPRIINIHGLLEPGGILAFPFTFMLADIITEVYGYTYSKYVIWMCLLAMGVFTFFSFISSFLYSPLDIKGYNVLVASYPFLYTGVLAGTVASFFINNAFLSKTKILMHGKMFWLRSIISSSIGHAIYSGVGAGIYFLSQNFKVSTTLHIVFSMYLWKTMGEVVLTPLACLIASWLKKKDNTDAYDYDIKFNPFKL